eukprot:3786787-Prymnesium_polylepis.1
MCHGAGDMVAAACGERLEGGRARTSLRGFISGGARAMARRQSRGTQRVARRRTEGRAPCPEP